MELTLHGNKDIYGVVCTVPPHLFDGESKVSTDGTCVVDIGMSKEDAEKVISIGDRASFRSSFSVLNENRVSSPYIDDRGGIAVLLKALEYTKTETFSVSCLHDTVKNINADNKIVSIDFILVMCSKVKVFSRKKGCFFSKKSCIKFR
jgi:endoglucanase